MMPGQWKINDQLVLADDVVQFIIDSASDGSEMLLQHIEITGGWWLWRWWYRLKVRYWIWRFNGLSAEIRRAKAQGKNGNGQRTSQRRSHSKGGRGHFKKEAATPQRAPKAKEP